MHILDTFRLHEELSGAKIKNKGGKMPTYEYKCASCNKIIELKHQVKDIKNTKLCPKCNSVLIKIFSLPHIRQNPEEYKKIGQHKKLMRKHYKE